MNRQQKELVIKELRECFKNNSSSFLIGVKGLSVKQTQLLRSGLRQKGGQLKVAKVRLIKRAVDTASFGKDLTPFLREQIGVVFADKEPSAVAKVLNDFSKENGALSLIAGYFESKTYDKAGVQRIASLPSRSVLLAQLCGTLNAPIAQLVRTLQAYVEKLSSVSGSSESVTSESAEQPE